jgi:hypothetical protein
MRQFKVGDKVRVISTDNQHRLPMGKIDTVVKIQLGGWIALKKYGDGWAEFRFELYVPGRPKKPKPKLYRWSEAKLRGFIGVCNAATAKELGFATMPMDVVSVRDVRLILDAAEPCIQRRIREAMRKAKVVLIRQVNEELAKDQP